MSDTGRITVERDGHLLLIGIDRPAKRNALTTAMYEEIARAYAKLDADDELRCGVLFAHGDHFTGGLDLPDWISHFTSGKLPLPDDGVDPVRLTGPALSKPVVSAVQGICFTIGIELMLATDVRIAAEDARFEQLEVRRGIYAVCGATIRWPREVGWGNAMRYLLTGDALDACEALRLGLVQEVVPVGEQLARAQEMANRIASRAPLAVRATLRSCRLAAERGQEAAVARLMPDLAPLIETEDVKEGFASYLERREARFTGR